ncbi:uncharacterized protein LOC128680796 isoform X2 [Plodia interpunctella]|nr:uncharacterized protein LOC128680796 isoform X2 [Plodia interpunctella]
MPKNDFRRNSRVLLGQSWKGDERGVASYVLHPEYEEKGIYNTVALVQLKDPVLLTKHIKIRPLCPPPEFIRDPDFYVVKFTDDFNDLQKVVIPVIHIPGDLCKEFYIAANLYARNMRPPHVACVISAEEGKTCVWNAGSALVSRDAWGRWMLLGLGVRGPGCSAPSRYLDMMSYYPWIEDSLNKFSRITISQISKQKYVLRASEDSNRSFQRFGACDPEEKTNLIYRELIRLKTDNNLYQFLTYNLTIVDSVEYTCLTLEMVNASAVSEMRIKHFCPREAYGPPCHYFRGSTFDVSVFMMFSDKFRFEMYAWGHRKQTVLLDIHEHKLEEGTYYDDFSPTRVEYKGTVEQTEFGFEPLDEAMWKPQFDLWVTTVYDPSAPKTTTKRVPSLNYHSEEEPSMEDTDPDDVEAGGAAAGAAGGAAGAAGAAGGIMSGGTTMPMEPTTEEGDFVFGMESKVTIQLPNDTEALWVFP